MKDLWNLPMMIMNRIFKPFLKKKTQRLFMIKICSCFFSEIYETIHILNPSFIKEIFTEKNSGYNLKKNILLISLTKPETNSYCIECATYMGSELWQELTNYIKTSSRLYERKRLKL